MRKTEIPLNTKLLCTSRVYWELDAASEVWHCLKATGMCSNAEIAFVRCKNQLIRGLFAVIFDGDPREAVKRIREYLLRRPWIMRYTQRIIPVELVTIDFNDVISFVKDNSKRIGENEKWMIRVSRHCSDISKETVIKSLATLIKKGSVDLNNPDWIINVECIGKTYAIAIIRREELLRKKEIQESLRGKLLENN